MINQKDKLQGLKYIYKMLRQSIKEKIANQINSY